VNRPRKLSGPGWIALLATAAAVACANLAMVWATPFYFLNNEELHNATVARELLAGNLRFLADYQYRPFCGGCSAVAVLGWLAYAVGGVQYLAWKAVAGLFTGGIVVAGHLLLRRTSGPVAAWAFALLMLAAPTILTQAMCMLWGNHFEVTALVLAQAAVAVALLVRGPRSGPSRAGWLAWGLVAGVGFWFCYHSAFALPTLLVIALAVLRPRRVLDGLPWLANGVIVGLLPLVGYALATGRSVFVIASFGVVPLGQEDRLQALPPGETLAMVPTRLRESTLGNYAGVMCGLPERELLGIWDGGVLPALWLAAAAGAVLAVRGRPGARLVALVPVALLAADMAAYTIAPWRTHPAEEGFPEPFRVRYLAPIMVLLVVSAAAGLGALWSRGAPGRIAAIVLAGAVILPGVAARIAWFTTPAPAHLPRAGQVQPLAYDFFQRYGAYHVDEEQRRVFRGRDWTSQVNHHRASGVDLAERLIRGDAAEARAIVAELRADPLRSDAQRAMVLHGMGRALRHQRSAFGLADGDYLPQLTALLEACDGGERRAVATGLWHRNRTLLRGDSARVEEYATDPLVLLPERFRGADCALCPALGEALSLAHPPEQIRTPADLVVGGEAGLPDDPGLRAAVIEGAGADLARAWGHRGAALVEVAAGFEPRDRLPFLRGLAVGYAASWARSASPDRPPERVP